MNLMSPVSTLMSTDLITVKGNDSINVVRNLFETKNIHHLPVVSYGRLIGIVSLQDYLTFLHGRPANPGKRALDDERLRTWLVSEIMTTNVATLSSHDPIRTAVDIFQLNRFHALPIADDDRLVGIITTHDLIDLMAREAIRLEDYKAAARQ